MGTGRIRTAIAREHFPLALFVSAAGWVALLSSHHALIVPGYCSASADSLVGRGWREMEAALYLNPPSELILPWLLMLLAMMPPLLTKPITHLSERSLARRRLRAVSFFIVGYGAVWMAAGIALMATAIAMKVASNAISLPALVPATAIAILWQVTPWKHACLNRCHRLPLLSALGSAADLDCLSYGIVAALWCVGACGALMLIPLVAEGAHIPLMAVISALLLAERLAPARPARWRFPFQPDVGRIFAILRTNRGGQT